MKNQIVQGSTREDFTVLPATDSTLCRQILELLRLEDDIEGWQATLHSLIEALGEEYPRSEIERSVESLLADDQIEKMHDGRLVIMR